MKTSTLVLVGISFALFVLSETFPFGTLFFDVMAAGLVCAFGWKWALLMRTVFFVLGSVTFALPTTLYLLSVSPYAFAVVYPIHIVTMLGSYITLRRFFHTS